MRKSLVLVSLATLLLLSACADEKVEPQHSPCVGLDNSPCGPKRPVNGKLNNTVLNTHRVALRIYG